MALNRSVYLPIHTDKHLQTCTHNGPAKPRCERPGPRDASARAGLAVMEFPFPSLERHQLPAQGQGYILLHSCRFSFVPKVVMVMLMARQYKQQVFKGEVQKYSGNNCMFPDTAEAFPGRLERVGRKGLLDLRLRRILTPSAGPQGPNRRRGGRIISGRVIIWYMFTACPGHRSLRT